MDCSAWDQVESKSDFFQVKTVFSHIIAVIATELQVEM